MNANQTEELERAHRQAVADGMVKVGLPMTDRDGCVEWCFAHRLSPTLARIDNVPVFCDEVHFGDVVQYREQDPPHPLFKDFVRVRTQGSTTYVFPVFDDEEAMPAEDEMRAVMGRVRASLLSMPEGDRPLAVEGVMAGWLASAWPLSVTREFRAKAIAWAVVWQGED